GGRVQPVGGAGGGARPLGALSGVLHPHRVAATRGAGPRPGHLEDAVASVELELSEQEMEELQQPYTPRAISGH
ncbi:aldo/keto reductase, partial [Streptomyces sp. NPDC004011]